MPAITYITRDEYTRDPRKWLERRSKKINDRVEVRIVEEEEEKAVTAQAATIEQVVEDVSHESIKQVFAFNELGVSRLHNRKRVYFDESSIDRWGVLLADNVIVIMFYPGIDIESNVTVQTHFSADPIYRDNPSNLEQKLIITKKIKVLYPWQSQTATVSHTIDSVAYVVSAAITYGYDISRSIIVYATEEWVDRQTGEYLGEYMAFENPTRTSGQQILNPSSLASTDAANTFGTFSLVLTRYNIPKPVEAVASSAYYGYYDTESAIGLGNL